jgi:methyl-accepting chemotaxis protein
VKISKQLKGTAIGVLAIGISSLSSAYINSLGDDSKVVNSAGIVRGGTQRLVKLELAGRASDKLIAHQDRLVKGLIAGDDILGLPAANDPEFIDRMKAVSAAWQQLKQTIVQARTNRPIYPELLDASERYFELADKAVSAAENYSSRKAQRLRTLQIAIFIASLILLCVIWITVERIANILENSTNDITKSSLQITKAVVEQEASVSRQSLAASKTTYLMGTLQKIVIQSNDVTESSVDRVALASTLIGRLNATTQQNFVEMARLSQKMKTLATHIDILDKQAVKIAKMTVLPEVSMSASSSLESKSAQKNTLDREYHNRAEINKLFANLQASIAAMALVNNDSTKIIEIEVNTAKETTETLTKLTHIVDCLSTNTPQFAISSKQYTAAVAQVMTLMEGLNLGAQETEHSIAQLGLSARYLGEVTDALQAKI